MNITIIASLMIILSGKLTGKLALQADGSTPSWQRTFVRSVESSLHKSIWEVVNRAWTRKSLLRGCSTHCLRIYRLLLWGIKLERRINKGLGMCRFWGVEKVLLRDMIVRRTWVIELLQAILISIWMANCLSCLNNSWSLSLDLIAI